MTALLTAPTPALTAPAFDADSYRRVALRELLAALGETAADLATDGTLSPADAQALAACQALLRGCLGAPPTPAAPPPDRPPALDTTVAHVLAARVALSSFECLPPLADPVAARARFDALWPAHRAALVTWQAACERLLSARLATIDEGSAE
jgi:hypothetical protein